MHALSRRHVLASAAATLAAAALPAVAVAGEEFIEVIVYDSIDDDIADAYATRYGGPRPPFRIERIPLAQAMRELRESAAKYGIEI
jgi:hypothetical protein